MKHRLLPRALLRSCTSAICDELRPLSTILQSCDGQSIRDRWWTVNNWTSWKDETHTGRREPLLSRRSVLKRGRRRYRNQMVRDRRTQSNKVHYVSIAYNDSSLPFSLDTCSSQLSHVNIVITPEIANDAKRWHVLDGSGYLCETCL